MNFKSILFFAVILLVSTFAHALPELTEGNIVKARANIRYWDIKAGPVSTGSTTGQEGSFKVERPTQIREGSLCHNYGTSCFCASYTKFRIVPSIENQWHALVDQGTNSPTICPAGVSPTGDNVTAGATKQGVKSREEIMAEKKAGRH